MIAGRVELSNLWPELAIIAVVFVATAWVSARMQDVTVTRYWDGDEYYVMTEQMAAGETPRAAAPYVYRLATPWLVAHLSPRAIVNGYRAINLTAAAVTAAMLLVWLRRFVAERWARLLAVLDDASLAREGHLDSLHVAELVRARRIVVERFFFARRVLVAEG